MRRLRAQLAGVTQPATSGKLPPLAAAIQNGESIRTVELLDMFRVSIESTIPTASLGEVAVLSTKNVLVAVSSGGGAPGGVQREPVNRSDRPYVGVTSSNDPVSVTPIYRLSAGGLSTTAGPPWFWVVARLTDPVSRDTFGTLIVEVNPTRFGEGMSSQVPAVDEAYLVDERGRLVVRATRPFTLDPELLGDLAARPSVAAALTRTVSAELMADPFGRGARLVSSARVPDLNARPVNRICRRARRRHEAPAARERAIARAIRGVGQYRPGAADVGQRLLHLFGRAAARRRIPARRRQTGPGLEVDRVAVCRGDQVGVCRRKSRRERQRA